MRWPLWVACAAAAAGTVILAATFNRFWPATQWTVLPRSQLLAKAKQVPAHFGLNVDGWKEYTVAKLSKSDAYSGKHFSPLSLRVTYVGKQNGQAAEAGLDSAGTIVYWRAPANYNGPQQFSSDEAAANAAFAYFAGEQAADYNSPLRSKGDETSESDFVWKKAHESHSDLRERIEIRTKKGSRGSFIERAEHKLRSTSDDDDSAEEAVNGWYWSVLSGIFGTLCTAGVAFILGIYILWLARRVVNHKFSLRLAGAGLVIEGLVMFLGADWQRSHSVSLDASLPIVPALFTAGLILCFTAVGRGISAGTRPKWMSLEQLCLLAPLSKQAGASLDAGILFTPLLVAVPFLIAGCGLFRHSFVLPRHVETIYSHAPLLDSIDIPSTLYLLGFFGFAVPVLERMISWQWLRPFILLPVGTAFFADQTRVITGQAAAPLAAGLLTLLIFWFLWRYFDLLAVLTAQVAGGIVLSWLVVGQKGGQTWSLVAALMAVLLTGFWIFLRGAAAAEGDKLATIPALTGFRAEREKLKAEFSLARRAQQDMLPQTPPSIPGYSIAASCTPSLEVGGDLYDFLILPDGRIGIGVADVSGKGVPAALYMTLTKGLLSSITKDSTQLLPIVEEVNRHLHGVTRKKVFVTMALAFLDGERRVLECVRAGHNPVVWRQTARDVTELVAPGGMGLGITASRIFSSQLKVAEMELGEGDAVVFYSDGITEAMNIDSEQFGEQRLMDAVRDTDHLDAAETRDSILKRVREFLDGVHPQDDMTLVVLRVGSGQTFASNSA